MGFAQIYEKISRDEQIKVEKELLSVGLNQKQIESLKKYKGNVGKIALDLMVTLPKKPSIHTVNNLLRTATRLRLIKKL